MSTDDIAKKFLKHDFHDMLLKEINFRSAADRRGKSLVTVVLLHWDKSELLYITFKQLANVSFWGDFDVLLDHAAPGNTYATDVSTDSKDAIRMVKEQAEQMGIEWEDKSTPVDLKIQNIDDYVVFKIEFIEGALEVLAQDFQIKRVKQ